ncbi:MAG: hypothetical protein ACI89J_002784 [Hyphomicrobiaceae bacterium]|jgi:hypothetical protein
MIQSSTPMMNKNEVELPGNMNPVLATLAFLPMMAIVLIALALAVEETPIPLIVLFVFVVGCCGMLSWTALQAMLGGKVTFDEDGLTIHRLLAEQRYPWSSIEACKVMPATGTLGDDAFVDADDRAGVGLFIKGLDRSREHDLDADVILCAGSKNSLQPLMQIANKVDVALKRAKEPAGRGLARGPQSSQQQPVRQRNPGARRPASAKAKVDPVAAFRNRNTAT